MKFADLIEIMKPYADKELSFITSDNSFKTMIDFYSGDDFVVGLSRRWGKEDIKVEIEDKE